jgi:hypothetical protein
MVVLVAPWFVCFVAGHGLAEPVYCGDIYTDLFRVLWAVGQNQRESVKRAILVYQGIL